MNGRIKMTASHLARQAITVYLRHSSAAES